MHIEPETQVVQNGASKSITLADDQEDDTEFPEELHIDAGGHLYVHFAFGTVSGK